MAESGAATAPVVRFYDTHPINERQILERLEADGADLGRLTAEELEAHDQDHFGGPAVVDALADAALIGPGSRVLDVCSGVGGPARRLARLRGARVTGLDVTASRHEAAVRLTRMVGLDHLVDFALGDARAMPFDDGTFDAVIGQEAWAHVPEKPRLVAECARVVRVGGRIAFTDILRRPALTEAEHARLVEEMAFLGMGSIEDYRGLLEGAGCRVLAEDDLTPEWTVILERRLAMYRGLGGQTAASFGEAHARRWADTYAFFVGLFGAGRLGGARVVAERVR